MLVVSGDVQWFADELARSDSASEKLLYLELFRAADLHGDAKSDPLSLMSQNSGKWSISLALWAARVIVADERTLWERIGSSFYSAFEEPTDPWLEQQAVKLMHKFLEHASRAELNALEEELQSHVVRTIKPQPSMQTVIKDASQLSQAVSHSDPAASAMAAAVVPMAVDDDYSEGCIVCSKPVKAFGELLRVPRDQMFFRGTVVEWCQLGRAIAAEPKLFESILESEETLLVLCLVYERHVVGATNSHWSRLLTGCPPSYPTVPSFWGFSDLSELAGMDIIDDIAKKKGQLQTFQEEVLAALPLLHEALQRHAPDATLAYSEFTQAFSLPTLQWARATFDSRAFKLNVDGTVVLALVPMADMINHQNRSDVVVRRVEGQGGDFVMQVGAPLEADDVGRELWMSYGPLQNWELLEFYGFVLADNIHDKLPFPLEISLEETEDPWEQRRHAIMLKFHLFSVGRAWIGSSGVPSEALVALLRLYIAEADEFECLEEAGPFAQLSQATEAGVMDTLRITISAILDEFSTTLDEDVEELEQLEHPTHDDSESGEADDDDDDDDDGHGLDNYKLCLRLRIGIKRIAHRTLEWCNNE